MKTQESANFTWEISNVTDAKLQVFEDVNQSDKEALFLPDNTGMNTGVLKEIIYLKS
jgi:hypothetical protein